MSKKRRPPRTSGRDRMASIPEVGEFPVTFESGKGFVTMVLHIGGSTLGLKFKSAEQMLDMQVGLIEAATIAWPDHPAIAYYLSDED